jgi:ribonucleoside-diphosphate reductase alpha chain
VQAKQEKGKQTLAKEEAKTGESTQVSASSVPTPEPLPLFKNEVKRPRARVLKGYTYRVETPSGTTFVTVNENGGDQPFELFMHTSKAGSDTAAISEAMGRLISYILRMNSPIEPRKRLHEVVRQLDGIGGGRSLGLGPNRVRSLPDGISQVLDEYLRGDIPDGHGHHPSVVADAGEMVDGVGDAAGQDVTGPMPGQMPLLPVNFKGDLCPECGQAAVVNEEGCRKCYACAYSEC